MVWKWEHEFNFPNITPQDFRCPRNYPLNNTTISANNLRVQFAVFLLFTQHCIWFNMNQPTRNMLRVIFREFIFQKISLMEKLRNSWNCQYLKTRESPVYLRFTAIHWSLFGLKYFSAHARDYLAENGLGRFGERNNIRKGNFVWKKVQHNTHHTILLSLDDAQKVLSLRRHLFVVTLHKKDDIAIWWGLVWHTNNK